MSVEVRTRDFLAQTTRVYFLQRGDESKADTLWALYYRFFEILADPESFKSSSVRIGTSLLLASILSEWKNKTEGAQLKEIEKLTAIMQQYVSSLRNQAWKDLNV
tara:strand:+ start:438 stop:752 length:315 start_codon:yes stop_codon:yes gene_type:complete